MEQDTITVQYDNTTLGIGAHEARIAITDSSAVNSPVFISVTLEILADLATLTADVDPPIGGTVNGAGDYFMGEVVTVEAIPSEGYFFDHWEGDDIHGSTVNPEQITMDGHKAVTAFFALVQTRTLSAGVSPVGSGSVSGAGVYLAGEVATVEATANQAWTFSHWLGAEINLSTSNPETVTMDSEKTVAAVFYLTQSTLGRIDIVFPPNESTVYTAPLFSWAVDGGTNNRYAVDLSLDSTFATRWSTFENLRRPISETTWQMPQAVWNAIPSGSFVYWRVRGADVNRQPLFVLSSNEVRRFYKY